MHMSNNSYRTYYILFVPSCFIIQAPTQYTYAAARYAFATRCGRPWLNGVSLNARVTEMVGTRHSWLDLTLKIDNSFQR